MKKYKLIYFSKSGNYIGYKYKYKLFNPLLTKKVIITLLIILINLLVAYQLTKPNYNVSITTSSSIPDKPL